MFKTIGKFGTMLQSAADTATTVIESGNDLAKIGRVKTLTLLRDELKAAGDLKTLKADLQSIGLEELSNPIN